MEKIYSLEKKNMELEQIINNSDVLSAEIRGTREAGQFEGKTSNFKSSLKKIYYQLLSEEESKLNNRSQKAILKAEQKQKLEQTIQNNNLIISNYETKDLPEIKARLKEVNSEISDIKKQPEKYINEKPDKLKYWMSLAILSILTIYLWLFYGSVAYSAFFREISFSKNAIFNTIFYARAWEEAFNIGLMSFLIIITIPFIFIGLGFSLHHFLESEGKTKYAYITGVFSFTFAFDALLAYEITQKIYDAKALNAFTNLPPYSFGMAFSDPNFWIIIAAGFMVYILWGFLYHIFSNNKSNTNKLNRLLRAKSNIIEELKKQENQIYSKISELKNENSKLQAEIVTLIESEKISPEYKNFVKSELLSYSNGWCKFLSVAAYPSEQINEVNQITNDFLQKVGL